MQEASQQAASWVPLLNVKCHADSKLFLCSLFAPVCLERPIYPCRSLCQKVKAGCEGTMKTYGFPWPTMLDCDKFPLDNDMCIASQSDKEADGEFWNSLKLKK
jgi:secreted frizzled-related protein 5